MSNEDVFPHYKALWKRLPKDDLWIHYYVSFRGEEGFFKHDGQGCLERPEIGIARPSHGDQEEPSMTRTDGEPVDLAREMVTFAHEYGHFTSWKQMAGTPLHGAYYAAIRHRDGLLDSVLGRGCTNMLTIRDRLKRRLSSREKTLILDEEARAWDLGRAFVPDALLPTFDARAHRGLAVYRFQMGLTNQRPSE